LGGQELSIGPLVIKGTALKAAIPITQIVEVLFFQASFMNLIQGRIERLNYLPFTVGGCI
jgi:hypothetical protein